MTTDERLDRLTVSVEALTYQVGLIPESMTEFRSDLTEIKASVRQQAETARQ